ncbi:hypothetical protein MPSEU_001045700 [Mayamaea pseudoterrestris]|nr:hypothetical protein MPSEU_001045700 [Mayamaea pseudoterrestris]
MIIFGQAALLYGSSGTRVEGFLEKLVEHTNCYKGNFFITNNELIASVWPNDDENTLPTTVMVKAPEGMHLHKLMLLSELAKDILKHKVSVEDAIVCKLPEIQASPDPYNVYLVSVFGFIGSSAGLAVLLGGSWWDTLLASIGGAICWCILTLSGKYLPSHVLLWTNAACAFVPAVLATSVKLIYPQVNVTIVTLSSVAIPLPGYTVSLGLAEIVGQRVTRGIGHLAKGLVTLLQLVMGSWLGVLFVSSIADLPTTEVPSEPMHPAWLAFFVPLLSLALVVAFQVSYRDSIWTMLLFGIGFGTTFAASKFIRPNFGIFLAAAVVFALSNVWSHRFDRPQSIVQVPATIVLVSGSIGFQGLTTLLAGETFLGKQQFMQMIIVALLIVAGEYTGNTLVRPETTL